MTSKTAEYLLKWCERHNPGYKRNLKDVLLADDRFNKNVRAVFVLLDIAFQAGRLYQQEHPSSDTEKSV